MFEVLKPGLETCIQDYPGRVGAFGMGFPPSGPLDHWSFRLANILVGNSPGQPALECQFIGPSLCFKKSNIIAICGSDMQPTRDGKNVPLWESIQVHSGQVLELKSAIRGARSYIAFSGGGIDVPEFLGSCSTFVLGQCGGFEGRPIKKGDIISSDKNESNSRSGLRIMENCRPIIAKNRQWKINVCAGPNDDWIDEYSYKTFLSSVWKVSPKSNRVGFRLEGPEWTFSDKATNKAPENGSDPSNTIDHGYPIGAVNLCGQTPIVLLNDTLTLGGFINPFTVPSSEFWKFGQSQPSDIYNFNLVSVEEAQAEAKFISQLCKEDSMEFTK